MSIDGMQPSGDFLRANRRTAYAAFAWVVVFLAWHVVWYFTGLEFPSASDQQGAGRVVVQAFTVVVVLLVIAGALLPLALARPWGRRVPRWMLLSAAWAGAVLLSARGVSGGGDDLVRVTGILPRGFTGLTTAQGIGTAHPSFWALFASAATDVLFAVGGLTFALAALAYRRTALVDRPIRRLILRYARSMSVKERITVTVDAEIVAQIKELAGRESTSSVVERALREMLTRQTNARARLEAMLAAHEHRDPEGFARMRAHVQRRLAVFEEPR